MFPCRSASRPSPLAVEAPGEAPTRRRNGSGRKGATWASSASCLCCCCCCANPAALSQGPPSEPPQGGSGPRLEHVRLGDNLCRSEGGAGGRFADPFRSAAVFACNPGFDAAPGRQTADSLGLADGG